MKRIISISTLVALVCGLAFVVSSCDMQEEFETPEQEVVFAAATSYGNLPDTRTVYSGTLVEVNGANRERIDWVEGTDKIKILNNNTGEAAVYTIGAPTASGAKSEASATPDGTVLVWGSGSTNTFYAAYPPTAMNASNQIGATIPTVQPQTESHTGPNSGGTFTNPTMNQYAYMVAKVTANNGSDVVLPFTPAMTAFEFKVGIAGTIGTARVTKFEMTSSATALTGDWSWDGATETFTCPSRVAGTNDKITVNFSPAATSTNSAPLKFTVFALPQNLSGVTITFTLSDNTTRSLDLPVTFTGTKKYRITTPGLPTDSNWRYVIEEIDDITTYGHLAVSSDVGIVSYRYIEENGQPVPGTYEAVEWQAQYFDGTDYQDWTAAQGDFSFGSSYSGNGVSDITTNELRTISLVDNTDYTETGRHSSSYILQHRDPVSNYSLANHDMYGTEYAQANTANTYVVTTSGSYNFPCVYGNAIKNGVANTSAYSGGSFRNAINAEITNPWINTDLGNYGLTLDDVNAVVVWQDEEIISATPTAQLIDSNYWIDFSIDQNEIKPGNAVIALRGTVKQGGAVFAGLENVILWSWQIWVSDQDMTPVDYMLPVNLGWNVDGEVQTRQYTNRELPIRIQQIAPTDDPLGAIQHEDFTFEQIADATEIHELAIGSNPYYQWGRKDPMIPGLYYPVPNERGDYCIDKTIYPGTDYSTMSSETEDPGSGLGHVEYGPGIRKPHVGFQNGWTTGWIGGNYQAVTPLTKLAPYNLWDNNITSANSTGSNDSSVRKIKTVYDPCPVGFAVPCYSRFNAYTVQNSTEADGGRNFTIGGETLFMPYSGARIFYNMTDWGEYTGANSYPIPAALYLRHVNKIGMYWTDTPYDDVRFASIVMFDDDVVARSHYTRGTAAAVRPMVDPKQALTVPSNYPPTDPTP